MGHRPRLLKPKLNQLFRRLEFTILMPQRSISKFISPESGMENVVGLFHEGTFLKWNKPRLMTYRLLYQIYAEAYRWRKEFSGSHGERPVSGTLLMEISLGAVYGYTETV